MGARLAAGGAVSLVLVLAAVASADPDPGDIFVADINHMAILGVDSGTGERVIVSGCFDAQCPETVGQGPAFLLPADVDVSLDGSLVVLDIGSPQALFRVDPITGDRVILSGRGQGSGAVDLFNAAGIAVFPALPPAVTMLPGWLGTTLVGLILGLWIRRHPARVRSGPRVS